ncbi:MAG: helix-turn-helix domain-containing protein [bacterium]|nr:helix-turn-helix domain-containing protein [bacterium]
MANPIPFVQRDSGFKSRRVTQQRTNEADNDKPSYINFGLYLRGLRNRLGLSLKTVSELTQDFPVKITKSHLSRIENALTAPSFGMMATLAQVYREPMTVVSGKFDIDYRRDQEQPLPPGRTSEAHFREAQRLCTAGRDVEALMILEALREEEEDTGSALSRKIELARVRCLVQLGKFGLAKEEAERLTSQYRLDPPDQIHLLTALAGACLRQRKFYLAQVNLDAADRVSREADVSGPAHAALEMARGHLLAATNRMAEAEVALGEATKLYEAASAHAEACSAKIDRAAVLIELRDIATARRLVGEALREAERNGFERQEACALSTQAVIAFREGNLAATRTACVRSNTIAKPRQYYKIAFRNTYFLWKIDLGRGDSTAAKASEKDLKLLLSRIEDPSDEVRDYLTLRATKGNA